MRQGAHMRICGKLPGRMLKLRAWGAWLDSSAIYPARAVMALILTAADRNSEIMHARCPPDRRIFSRFWIDILMNND